MKFKGLFIGLSTVDIQYFVDSFPASNTKLKTEAPDLVAGGPATNAAVIFSKLNNGAYLASPFGENAFSGFFKDDMNACGVSHTDLVANGCREAVVASVITSADNGDRNIFTNNPVDIDCKLTPEDLFEQVKPEIILLDGFYPAFSIACAQLAKRKGIPVVLDCGSWKPQFQELLPLATIAICSADFHPPATSNSEELMTYLVNTGLQLYAITRGQQNISGISAGEKFEIEVEKIRPKDTLGAGDFFHGAFCYAYLESGNFIESLRYASTIATRSCRYKGTRYWLKTF